jgi:glycine reductase
MRRGRHTRRSFHTISKPDADSTGLYAETMMSGDPSYAGPLAGVPLGLPVFHILEPEIKEQIDPSTYREQVGMMELALDAEAIRAEMQRLRAQE